jgi:superfamily II DNA/RNA helicase
MHAGSGKTLAFLLPLVISAKRAAIKGQEGLKALIVSPTRELAEQTARVLLLLVKELRLSCCLLSTAATAAGTDFSKVASHPSLFITQSA